MLYPVWLKVTQAKCLVVGGGQIALRRATTLLSCGAHVVVVSPELCPELAAMHECGDIAYIPARYDPSHVTDSKLVIAATDSRDVNAAIGRDARKQGILCNMADSQAESDFFLPSVVACGSVQVAISTGGSSPATAKALRLALAADMEDGGNRFVSMLRSLPDSLSR
ncbi:precorrin-2 dehydrogenase/sirohydrochlorin ferrochelatase [Alicyclobacillus sacchari]|uniref:precorrin-2 dehydrogenase n=1 Tax=Alicyclobacillus sacchari TaxID=392010 RepID=A0A4V3HF39_9BACL|nr:precorrin-2 dehydrogenase/sirohydrochlorin ferrochelatase [Alicyclobacillus sacchari]GMA56682.1 hypothetical protein GCM10025858_11850 [Alicyclobacillus sacchari]